MKWVWKNAVGMEESLGLMAEVRMMPLQSDSKRISLQNLVNLKPSKELYRYINSWVGRKCESITATTQMKFRSETRRRLMRLSLFKMFYF